MTSRRIEKLKLLSKLEEAGVLSALEKSGVTLEFIEENKLLSKAESAGAISLLNDRCRYSSQPSCIGVRLQPQILQPQQRHLCTVSSWSQPQI